MINDITYYIDHEGYLLDNDRYYLTNSVKNERVRLDAKHIDLLKERKMLIWDCGLVRSISREIQQHFILLLLILFAFFCYLINQLLLNKTQNIKINSNVKSQTTMPIPAYDNNLKKPIWLSFIISFIIFDLPDNVFNCLSCFWFICAITMLSFFRSEPNLLAKLTHVYGLTLEPIK